MNDSFTGYGKRNSTVLSWICFMNIQKSLTLIFQLGALLLLTSQMFSQSRKFHLEIEATPAIYFWEPLEVKVQLIYKNRSKVQVIAPPQGQVSIRLKGQEKWQRVLHYIPQGVPFDGDKFQTVFDSRDTVTTHLLVLPLQYYVEGQEKQYNFKPYQEYEVKYCYLPTNSRENYLFEAISTFSTKGDIVDDDFLLLDQIEKPFFLFEPGYNRLQKEYNCRICHEIIEKESSTFYRWCRLYLYMQEYDEFARQINDNSTSFEKREELYREAKKRYHEYRASCDSQYIIEVLNERFRYSWLY